MSGIRLLISFVVATIAWQFIAETFGPGLSTWLYRKRVMNLQQTGMAFKDDAALQAWSEKTMASSINAAFLLLAAGCGALAGMLSFPLLGISRSTNVWSWVRIIVLCGASWLVASVLYPGRF